MLGEKIIVQLSSDFFVGLIGFLTTIIIAKFLGATVVGTVAYTLGIIGILTLVGDLGFSQAHIKRLAEGKNTGDKLSTFLFIRVSQAILFLVVGAALFFLSRSYFPQFVQSGQESGVFVLLLLSSFLVILTSFFTSTFQGRQEVVKTNLPFASAKVVKFVLTVVVVVFLANALGVALTNFIESLVLFLISFFLFKNLRFAKPKFSIAKSYFSYALPLIVVNSLSYFMVNIDKIVLKYFWTTEMVGWYFAVQGLASLPQLLSSSMMTMFFPNVSQLYMKGKIDEIREKCLVAVRYLLLVTVPTAVAFIFFRKEVVLFFLGDSFVGGVDIFIPFAFLIVIIAIVRPYSNILFAIEKHGILVKVSLINSLVLVILNLLLVPRELFGVTLAGLGGVGSALANVVVWIISGAVQIYVVRRNTGVFLFSNILAYLFCGLLMYLTFLIVFNLSFITSYTLRLFATIASGVAVYISSLHFLGELSEKDILYLLKIAKPANLLISAKKEIKK